MNDELLLKICKSGISVHQYSKRAEVLKTAKEKNCRVLQISGLMLE